MDKHMWTKEETEAFVDFMEECIIDGLKADCGQFKSRTFNKLALKMLEVFPTCTLTAKHCKNKHKRLKEKYQYASEMLACSRFEWNSDKYRDVFYAWIKVHPTKFYTPGKPFPLFHRLEGISERIEPWVQVQSMVLTYKSNKFTRRRKIIVQVWMILKCQQIQVLMKAKERKQNNILERMAKHVHMSKYLPMLVSKRNSGKKQKQNDILERMAEHVQFLTAAQGKNVQVLVDAISGVNEKFKISEKLEQLGFSDDEVVQVVLKFSDNPQLEKSFWDLTDSQKSALV
ncbi:hypothetical protein Ahy_B10g105557 [Arachis hypogaea]|uniref:Myb/SANT-like domain-containing protein n=1 Tax=Arachis hypogaea TaxID=3818 RepID=A0A444X890_ARAHY|nr:hypothetical protein Ahy_B10g105557 [Arachis hypogaea]